MIDCSNYACFHIYSMTFFSFDWRNANDWIIIVVEMFIFRNLIIFLEERYKWQL